MRIEKNPSSEITQIETWEEKEGGSYARDQFKRVPLNMIFRPRLQNIAPPFEWDDHPGMMGGSSIKNGPLTSKEMEALKDFFDC